MEEHRVCCNAWYACADGTTFDQWSCTTQNLCCDSACVYWVRGSQPISTKDSVVFTAQSPSFRKMLTRHFSAITRQVWKNS